MRLGSDLTAARQRATGMTEIWTFTAWAITAAGRRGLMLDEGLHWAGPGHVTPKYEFGTAQSYFSSIEKQIAPESPVWNYASIAKGYTPPPPVAGKVNHSHVEERAVLRVSSRRDDDAGQSQAQYARG